MNSRMKRQLVYAFGGSRGRGHNAPSKVVQEYKERRAVNGFREFGPAFIKDMSPVGREYVLACVQRWAPELLPPAPPVAKLASFCEVIGAVWNHLRAA